jgi:enolase
MEAIEKAGYEGKCTVGLDVAASEFKVKDSPAGAEARYDLGMWDAASQEITGPELMEFYAKLIADFPVVTVEDGFDEDDWPNWSEMVSRFGTDVQSAHSRPPRTAPVPSMPPVACHRHPARRRRRLPPSPPQLHS